MRFLLRFIFQNPVFHQPAGLVQKLVVHKGTKFQAEDHVLPTGIYPSLEGEINTEFRSLISVLF